MNSNIITSEDMKQKFIKHLQEDIYCRIGVSSIHGIGVIAIKDIPKGTYPFKKLSDDANEKIIILDDNDLKNVNKNVVKIVGDFFDGTGHGTYPILYNGPNNLSISYYLNHSDNPNMEPVYNQELSNTFLSFITLRDIKEGEELTFNYSKHAPNGIILNKDISNKEKTVTKYKFTNL